MGGLRRKKRFDYDLIVIGSGAGGSVASHQLAKAGKKVAIVEADKIGGECPNVGCVPTKALLHAAEIYESAKNASRFGIRASTIGYNYPTIKAWKNLAVRRTGTYLGEKMYDKEGIDFIRGRARFIDPNTITIGSSRYTSRQFLIATGAQLVVPRIPGLDKTGYITSEKAVDLSRPPKSLAIIGGGAIGCELANLFAIFGTKVHVVDMAPALMAKEDPEVGAFLGEHFESHYGMKIYTKATVQSVEKKGLRKSVTVKIGSKTETIAVEEILLATGKKASVDIGLENAGVDLENGFIKVSEYLQTTQPHIFAAGDCVGPYLFTHMATYQSRIVSNNIQHPKKKIAAQYYAVPRCIFTIPEIASVGPTETELKNAKYSYITAITPLSIIGRANANDVRDGFVKVIADKKSKEIISAAIVAPRAGEMIHELALAVKNNLTAENVADTIHAFPTWSEAVRVACSKLSRM